MVRPPAVVVHGLAEVRVALAPGLPVTLLSAPGAVLFGGCLWWRDLMAAGRALAAPGCPVCDLLDCADASGQAMAALRVGVCHLVLWPGAPGHVAVAAIAAGLGGAVLGQAPPALDLAERGAGRLLSGWLCRDSGGAVV